jgi:hypothetical protein
VLETEDAIFAVPSFEQIWNFHTARLDKESLSTIDPQMPFPVPSAIERIVLDGATKASPSATPRQLIELIVPHLIFSVIHLKHVVSLGGS